MCGLAGIVEFESNSGLSRDVIKKMTDSMTHRGPNADGFFYEDGVSLGHRRLSIIDLSDSANQPFTDQTGRYVIVFNGEIYNFREVRAELTDYDFITSGDTEVILAAYLKWKQKAFLLLKGMFSILIWDTTAKQIIAVRDRMGVKPLYYYFDDQRIIFASEIKGLIASGVVPSKVDKDSLVNYFSFQSVSGNKTIIKDVYQLEAGCYLTVNARKPVITRYWDITDLKNDFDFDDDVAVRQNIRRLLLNSVERRLISDVPLGAFLSGGIDSSAVVALMAECSVDRPNTFTIGFGEKAFDETPFANIIAAKFNTRHNQVLLNPEILLTDLTCGLDAMDTPTGDGINTFIVSRAIKESGLTVALSGIGGDELFAGYPFFRQYISLRKYKKIWPYTKLARAGARSLISFNKSMKTERIGNILTASNDTIEELYPEFRRIVSQQALKKLTNFSGDSWGYNNQQLRDLGPAIRKFPDLSQVSIAEYNGYTQHTLLKDTDQMSMAVSLEVREPFFDHDLVEFVLAVPDSLKFPKYPKSLLVESLGDLLPPEIVHRKKQGFLFPWSIWLRGPMRSFCEQRIYAIAKRDFINEKNLINLWTRFLKGDNDINWAEIWLFVVLEYWLNHNKVE